MEKDQYVAEALDDILETLHEALEEGANADRVREIAEEHSAFRAEILAFAAEWFASDGSDLPDDTLVVEHTVSDHAALLDRFWQMAAADAANPFQQVSPDDLLQMADRCRVDMVVLRQLVRGFVDAATIPAKLISWLAAETHSSVADVWSHFGSPAVATADFFAPSGKSSSAKLSFGEVIRNSNLSPENKQFWLAHLDA